MAKTMVTVNRVILQQFLSHLFLGLSTVRRYMTMLSMVLTESGFNVRLCVVCACVEGEGVEGREDGEVVTVAKKSWICDEMMR